MDDLYSTVENAEVQKQLERWALKIAQTLDDRQIAVARNGEASELQYWPEIKNLAHVKPGNLKLHGDLTHWSEQSTDVTSIRWYSLQRLTIRLTQGCKTFTHLHRFYSSQLLRFRRLSASCRRPSAFRRLCKCHITADLRSPHSNQAEGLRARIELVSTFSVRTLSAQSVGIPHLLGSGQLPSDRYT